MARVKLQIGNVTLLEGRDFEFDPENKGNIILERESIPEEQGAAASPLIRNWKVLIIDKDFIARWQRGDCLKGHSIDMIYIKGMTPMELMRKHPLIHAAVKPMLRENGALVWDKSE